LVSIAGDEVVVLASAVATFADFVPAVKAGAVAEDPVGNVHVTSDCPGTQAEALATFNVSEAEFPVSMEVLMKRLPVVLRYVPAGAVTLIVMVQTVLPARIPPLSLMPGSPTLRAPLVSSVSDPPHVLVVVVFASVIPAGNVSTKVTPVNCSVVGLVSLIVIRDVPPGAIALGLKDLLIVIEEGPMILAIREPVLKSAL